ncbi:hypothetical protein [Brevundimonas sp.]|uniref:hypothetical protein n=1 Tax=Brevundimonas sp. TaxID=1871086 RepID=UPI00356791F6
MFHKTLLAVVGGALALTVCAAQPAFAQEFPQRDPSDEASGNIRGERVQPGRINEREGREERERRPRPAPEPTPEENRVAAQALLTAANVGCQVTEAARLGVTAQQALTFEAVCASGPGYLAVAGTPPQTFNCLELAGQAVTTREREPAANVGQQCTLPVNQNAVPVVGTFAREAGITCTVDQAAAFAMSLAGNLIYEVGCADQDGYWIEKTEAGWDVSPCFDLILQGDKCRFSTAAESTGAWKTVLAGTEAAPCDVQQARRVGRDAQGLTVYEVKCVVGEGYFARVDAGTKAQRIHPCAQAAHIGGGCTLTTVAAAATTE